MTNDQNTSTTDFDAIENARIEADMAWTVGPYGPVVAYRDHGDEGVTGWNAFGGAVQILRIDLPIGSITEEEPEIAEARQSILGTIRQAYTAGRSSIPSFSGDFEAAVAACEAAMDTDWHTAEDVVKAVLRGFLGVTERSAA